MRHQLIDWTRIIISRVKKSLHQICTNYSQPKKSQLTTILRTKIGCRCMLIPFCNTPKQNYNSPINFALCWSKFSWIWDITLVTLRREPWTWLCTHYVNARNLWNFETPTPTPIQSTTFEKNFFFFGFAGAGEDTKFCAIDVPSSTRRSRIWPGQNKIRVKKKKKIC